MFSYKQARALRGRWSHRIQSYREAAEGGDNFSRVLEAAEGHNFSHTLGETCCYGVSMN